MAKSLQGGLDLYSSFFYRAEVDGWVFPILGQTRFRPENPEDPPVGWTTEEIIEKKSDVVSFAGTLSGLTVYIGPDSNVRITTGQVVVYKNGVATSLLVEIPPSTSGYFVSEPELTLDFVAGDRLQGRVFLPAQDEESIDPPFVDYDCYIGGVWVAMETTGGHYGVHRTDVPATADGGFLIRGQIKLEGGGGDDFDYYNWHIGGETQRFIAQQVLGDEDDYVLGLDEAGVRSFARQKIRAPGTFVGMTFDVTVNSSLDADTESEWFLEVDGERRGTLACTLVCGISSSTDGIITDDGTAAVADGELVCYGVDNIPQPIECVLAEFGCANHTLIRRMSHDFLSEGETLDVFMSLAVVNGWNTETPGAYFPISADMTGSKVIPIFGHLDGSDGYSTQFWDYLSVQPPFDLVMSHFRLECVKYEGDPITFTVMVDGVLTDQTFTVDGTGWFEDEINVTQVPSTSAVCFHWEVAEGETFSGILKTMAWTQGEFTDVDEYGCDPECPTGETFASIKVKVLKMLGEDSASPVYWTNAEIGRYVNDAYMEFCRDTKALEYIEGVALAADSQAGTLSDRVGQVFRVTFDDRKIDNLTKWELDRSESNWENQSGFVSHYITTLQDQRTISTFKAWDGTEINAKDLFFNDGAYTYAAWANATVYAEDDRVTVVDDDGHTLAYVAIAAHTAATATNKPGSGSAWEAAWVPIALMVWHIGIPPVLADCDELQTPPWSHLGVAFLAASKALGKRGEMRNPEVAAVYAEMAAQYAKTLKGHVAQRAPERIEAMGRGANRVRRPRPWDQVIED